MLIRSGMGMQLSGSVGGVVASRNAGGAYLRNRTVPVNPNSLRQQQARLAFAAATIAWRTLTSAERGAWDAYAIETPLLNRLGESITVSGSAHYVRTNAFLLGLGLPRIDVAPASPGLSTLGSVTSLDFVTGGAGFAFVTVGNTALGTAIFQFGPPVSAGVSFFKGPFSRITSNVLSATGTANTPDSPAGFRYGTPLLGERRFARIAGIDAAGRLSNSIILPVVVTDPV